MTDNLVKRLRLWEYVFPGDELKKPGHLYHEAADRIKALEAALAESKAEVAHMRAALVRIADLTQHNMGMTAAEEACVYRECCAALNTPDPKAGG